MISEIVSHTNKKILTNSAAYGEQNQYKVKEIDQSELQALFGCFDLAGSFKSSRQNVKDLWATDDTVIPILRKTMTLQRFNFILCCLRVDHYETKKEINLQLLEQYLMHFFPIADELILRACIRCIDEQLVAFRANCSFR